jgi:hypothetical protein
VKVIVLNCPCFVFINDSALKDAVYVLFREVMIGVTCVLVLEAIYYYEIMSFNYYYDKEGKLVIMGKPTTILSSFFISGSTYCALLAFLIWALLGFFICVFAQMQIDKWK